MDNFNERMKIIREKRNASNLVAYCPKHKCPALNCALRPEYKVISLDAIVLCPRKHVLPIKYKEAKNEQ